MVRKVKDDVVVDVDPSLRKLSSLRLKQPSVDLNDYPFASDRQLEDQRYLIQQNRNPRFFESTKVDKVRSQTLNSSKVSSRAIGMKAKVLNKIVREASGVHTYALVPPPIQLTGPDMDEEVDSSTNPRVRVYAKEAISKPVICSFGHRPKSASRVFNPATMKVRLRHGEIVKTTSPSKTGVGLPVHVLKKVLKAPKLTMPGLEDESNEHVHTSIQESTFRTDTDYVESQSREDVYNLFGAPQGVESNVEKSNVHDNSVASWITNDANETSMKAKGKGGRGKPGIGRPHKLEPISTIDDRPAWNEAFHRNDKHISEVYQLKASGINTREALPLQERLTRFNIKAGPSNDRTMFCVEKQINDIKVLHGIIESPKKPSPVKGQKLYYDPLNAELQQVIKLHQVDQERRRDHWKKKSVQDAWKTVPKVSYNPIVEFEKMKTKTSLSTNNIDSIASNESLQEFGDSIIDQNHQEEQEQDEEEYLAPNYHQFGDEEDMEGFELIHDGDQQQQEEEE